MTQTIDERHWTDRLRIGIPRDLREIRRLYAELADEAAHRADDASHMPGGDAMALMGPVANLEAWQHRYESAEERGLTARTDYAADQIDAEDHPLLVLATWEDLVREERDQPTALKATVDRAADYLLRCLDWMLSTDEYGSATFLAVTALAADLRRVRARLEAVLRDGEQVDRGVPCMSCGVALVRVWGEDEDADRWHCRPCGEWSTLDQYNQAVKADYLREAEWLTATDVAEAYRIPVGTLQGWASKDKVRKRRDPNAGRMVYSVADALSWRDRTDAERHAAPIS